MHSEIGKSGANFLLGRIALALLAFTIAAFGVKAIAHPEVQVRYTPLVIIHAASMLAWLALLAGQAFLAAGGRFAFHRALGRSSIALVAVMTVSGLILSVNIGEELGRVEVTIVNIAAFATFIPLYFAALWFARHKRIAEHRMAMLIGTLAFMTPAYARVTQVLELPDPVAIAIQPPITIAVALGYEWVTQRRVTKPTLAMLAFSVGLIVVMAGALLAFVPLEGSLPVSSRE
ncbi:hypothetical protein NAP1_00860 [Erythrobacter sp. NAP1]|uniref:hypothetical protein n=1 Tax=Erythrobacter sp. NAP1 TaxID=237727 RepID=UPI0000686CBB|nr:hypothetical protein [Erythrobacter sp. NAP1]EAQ29278.1 hypothetical protein NAP1_00860 [Erythrobacter sp. NAP1]